MHFGSADEGVARAASSCVLMTRDDWLALPRAGLGGIRIARALPHRGCLVVRNGACRGTKSSPWRHRVRLIGVECEWSRAGPHAREAIEWAQSRRRGALRRDERIAASGPSRSDGKPVILVDAGLPPVRRCGRGAPLAETKPARDHRCRLRGINYEKCTLKPRGVCCKPDRFWNWPILSFYDRRPMKRCALCWTGAVAGKGKANIGERRAAVVRLITGRRSDSNNFRNGRWQRLRGNRRGFGAISSG